MGSTVLDIRDFSFTYEGASRPVLAGIDLRVRAGECVCMTGATGSGKSTLVLAIKDLLPEGERSGEISLAAAAGDETVAGMVLQNPETQLVTGTVGEEVAFGLENLGVEPALMHGRITGALEAVGLPCDLDRRVSALSMGQKYRLIMAAILVIRPRLLILDEPGAQLDDAGVADLIAVIAGLKQRGIAVLLSEHHHAAFAEVVDLFVHLDRGVLSPGPPSWPARRLREVGAGSRVGDPVLRVENLTAGYGEGARHIEGLFFSAWPGDRLVVNGPNGTGKTTLMRCLTGFLEPDEGTVLLAGRAPDPVAFRRHARYLFQNPQRQFFENTVFDEVAFSLKYRGYGRKEKKERVMRALERCGIADLADRSPFKLSYGQQHLAAIASLVVDEPALLLLDDPFAGLDPLRLARVLDVLDAYVDETGAAIVLTTHSAGDYRSWAGSWLELAKGERHAEAPPARKAV